MNDQSKDFEIEFPCVFPIKVMGNNHIDFEAAVAEIVRRHAPDLGEGAITSRSSKGGKYLAITVTIKATSKNQLDNIYRELSAHELVIMAI